MWMYRAKRFYSMGEADVKKHQIPVSYRLRSAETKRLLETETAEQFVEFVRQTAYFRGKQAVLEPEDELTWERVMIRTYEKICKNIQCPWHRFCVICMKRARDRSFNDGT